MELDWLRQRNQRIFDTPAPVALVTGSAANRVGRTVGQLLLDGGFRVAFHGHRVDGEAERYVQSQVAQGRQATLLWGSVERSESAPQWLDRLLELWGRVDLLVNSAAVWQPKPLAEVTAEDVRRHFEVNALGSFLTAQRFGLRMVEQSSGGAVIQIGDWAVARPYVDFAAYFVSKGTLETMTRSLAVELATRNPRVRVNAVLPGTVLTAPGISSHRHERIIAHSLLQRAGTPLDIAEAVYFLATSPFITGVCLPVDGGRTVYAGPAADAVAHPDVNDQ